MQGDILNNFLFLVHITFWQGNILFSFKVKFCSIDITPALPLRNSKEKPRYRINFSAKTLSDMNSITGLVHNSSSDKLQLTIQTSHSLLSNRHTLSTDQSSNTLLKNAWYFQWHEYSIPLSPSFNRMQLLLKDKSSRLTRDWENCSRLLCRWVIYYMIENIMLIH